MSLQRESIQDPSAARLSSPKSEAGSPSATEEIHCPLCEYNLHGLPEPRCPECGARFDWEELRDPTRRLHPYLFEHHPERPVESFIRTMFAGFRPRRFWKTVFPSQPSYPRRLVLYWIICIVLSSLSVALQLYSAGYILNRTNQAERAALAVRIAQMERAGETSFKNSILQNYGSIEAYVVLVAPPYPSAEFFKQLTGLRYTTAWRGRAVQEPWGQRCFMQLLLTLAWPGTTVLVLMLLRATMRRAQVRRIHLLRVAIYCSDVTVWLGLLLLLPILFEMNFIPGGAMARVFDTSIWWPAIAGAVLLIRLSFAISRYLRFRHAFPTALAVQIIFGLAAMKLYMILLGY